MTGNNHAELNMENITVFWYIIKRNQTSTFISILNWFSRDYISIDYRFEKMDFTGGAIWFKVCLFLPDTNHSISSFQSIRT